MLTPCPRDVECHLTDEEAALVVGGAAPATVDIAGLSTTHSKGSRTKHLRWRGDTHKSLA